MPLAWDIPLTEGYDFEQVPNRILRPRHASFPWIAKSNSGRAGQGLGPGRDTSYGLGVAVTPFGLACFFEDGQARPVPGRFSSSKLGAAGALAGS